MFVLKKKLILDWVDRV